MIFHTVPRFRALELSSSENIVKVAVRRTRCVMKCVRSHVLLVARSEELNTHKHNCLHLPPSNVLNLTNTRCVPGPSARSVISTEVDVVKVSRLGR